MSATAFPYNIATECGLTKLEFAAIIIHAAKGSSVNSNYPDIIDREASISVLHAQAILSACARKEGK